MQLVLSGFLSLGLLACWNTKMFWGKNRGKWSDWENHSARILSWWRELSSQPLSSARRAAKAFQSHLCSTCSCLLVVAQWQNTGCTSQVSWVQFLVAAGLFTLFHFKNFLYWRKIVRHHHWIQRPGIILALLLIVLFLAMVQQQWGPKTQPHRVQQAQAHITMPTRNIPNAHNG